MLRRKRFAPPRVLTLTSPDVTSSGNEMEQREGSTSPRKCVKSNFFRRRLHSCSIDYFVAEPTLFAANSNVLSFVRPLGVCLQMPENIARCREQNRENASFQHVRAPPSASPDKRSSNVENIGHRFRRGSMCNTQGSADFHLCVHGGDKREQ